MIDWDAVVLGPVMAIFGEGEGGAPGVLYSPLSGGQINLYDAVYDANYSRTEMTTEGVPVITSFPVLGVRTAELPSPAQGDRLTIIDTDETYAVADVIPDGHGHILLRLEQADAV